MKRALIYLAVILLMANGVSAYINPVTKAGIENLDCKLYQTEPQIYSLDLSTLFIENDPIRDYLKREGGVFEEYGFFYWIIGLSGNFDTNEKPCGWYGQILKQNEAYIMVPLNPSLWSSGDPCRLSDFDGYEEKYLTNEHIGKPTKEEINKNIFIHESYYTLFMEYDSETYNPKGLQPPTDHSLRTNVDDYFILLCNTEKDYDYQVVIRARPKGIMLNPSYRPEEIARVSIASTGNQIITTRYFPESTRFAYASFFENDKKNEYEYQSFEWWSFELSIMLTPYIPVGIFGDIKDSIFSPPTFNTGQIGKIPGQVFNYFFSIIFHIIKFVLVTLFKFCIQYLLWSTIYMLWAVVFMEEDKRSIDPGRFAYIIVGIMGVGTVIYYLM